MLTQNIQVWSSQCRSLCFQPKARPVQKSGLDGRRNGDRGGGDLAEQGERRQQRESREQRLDPLARPCQDEKCKRRVRVRLFQRHVQCHDHQVTILNIFLCQHLQTKFVEIFPTSKNQLYLSVATTCLVPPEQSPTFYSNLENRRLERDTSVDRLSTGSRESMQSTQSEWLPGEKKKSRVRPCKSLSRLYFYSVSQGLLGKLKNAVKKDRNISEEREFGSGSDISSASVQSKQSTSSKMSTASKLIQRARYTMMVCKFLRLFFNIVCLLRSASKDRLNASKGEKEKPTPAQHNAKFDQMFDKAGTAEAKSSTPGPTAPARPSASTVPRPAAAGSSSTLPRTYRRF